MVPSVVSVLVNDTETSAVGCELSLRLNLDVPPISVVLSVPPLIV